MRIFWLVFVILFAACKRSMEDKQVCHIFQKSERLHFKFIPPPVEKETVLIEYFVDSLLVGIKTKNSVELLVYENMDSSYVEIRFWSKHKKKKWELKQHFEWRIHHPMGIDAQITDLARDGFGDLTYRRFSAARGGNDPRELLVYDREHDELIYVQNSSSYPNLQANKILNCLDAWYIYGGSSTVFLHLQGDSLVPFAGVDSDEKRTVWQIDDLGNKMILRCDTVYQEDDYTRYMNYQPLCVNPVQ